MIIVDTNVWSVQFSRHPNPRVVDWLIAHERSLWLSTIVIAEIRYGAELPKAKAIRLRLVRWLDILETTYADRILPFTSDAAHLCGALRAQRPDTTTLLDLQIAAQALAHDCPIATRNVTDFAWTGVKLINPWGD
ncbi:PIN domain-containing protein [Blastomonas sp. AAP53]|uniref:PIN domain-containing protein n=1 Tax=Blastomonas sp. AAP53 TaxID=1248760 RepID=UPI0002FEFB10|nr:PIN domain-containing protein [Blastomonas sp. AAP53]